MQTLLRISDAAAIALHAADYLSARPGRLATTQEMAKALDFSYNHLSKVLQQLTRAGLITATRGPKGGFALSPAGRKAALRDFIEATDGPAPAGDCLLKHMVCGGRSCVLGDFLRETNIRLKKVLDTKISDMGKSVGAKKRR